MANSRGGGSGPTADQLKIAEQMFKMMEQMKTSADKIANSFESQAASTAKMAENMKAAGGGELTTQLVQINETLKQVAASLTQLNTTSSETFAAISAGALGSAGQLDALTEATEGVGQAAENTLSDWEKLKQTMAKTGKGAKGLKDKLKDVGDYLEDNFPVATGAALGALSGLQQAFSNIVGAASSITGFFSSVISTVFELGKAIIALPFKILGGLIEMANSGGGGVSELAEAVNGLRKEFGALTGPTNTAIMGLSNSMGSLNVGGVGAMKIFGNVADRINMLKDLFLQGGAAVRSFTDEIVRSNGVIPAYQKGLGVSNEEMGSLASMAKRDGKTMTSVLNNITKQSLAMGKAFGLDAKLISKEMAKAAANMAQFGHMSEKQLGVAVTYAAKLGMNLENIAGTLDQFALFEDAAENVSQLNNVFGTNIDLNEIMEAQDPAAQSEIIRKAMLAQGVAADKLDFRQRKLLKSATGWDDSAVNAELSTSNMNVSLNEMKKVGDKVEKTVMSDAQAMSKLADAMERVFKGGGDRPKSFWDAFTTGLERGFKTLPGVQKLFQNIRGSTDQFTIAGTKMSQMIYDKFPGVKKMIEALTGLFDPKKFSGLLDKILGHIGKFMDDLKTGKASFADLMQHLKDEFFNFFKGEGSDAEGLLSGFDKFFDAIKLIFAQGIAWAMESLGNLISDMVDSLSNPKPSALSGAGDAAAKILTPVGEALSKGWSVLGPALGKLFDYMFTALGDIIAPKIKAWAAENWHWIALFLFGPAAMQALLGAGTALLVKGLGKLLSKAFGSAAKSPSVQDSIKKMHEDVSSKLEKMQGGSQAAASQPTMTDEQVKNYKKMETSVNWSKVLQFLVGLAGVVAIGLAAYWVALKIVRGKSIQDLVAAGLLLVVVATTAVIAAQAFKQLDKVKDISLADIGKFLALFAGVMLVGVLAVGQLAKIVKKNNVGAGEVAAIGGLIILIGAMAAMAAVIAALAAAVGEAITKDPKAFGYGMLAIGLIVLALVGTAALIMSVVKENKDVNPAALEAVVKLLDSIGNLAMKAGIIAAEAMVIGAILIGSAGTAVAALGAGLAVMGSIITALSAGALAIMDSISKMKVDNISEFEKKIDAFEKVMYVIIDMTDSIGSIIDTMDDMTSIFSSAEDDRKMVDSITKFVKTIFDGIKPLVDTMIKAAKEIPVSQIEPIKAFASLLNALGTLIGNVGQSATNFSSGTASWSSKIFGSSKDVENKMAKLTDYIDKLLPAMKDLISTMISGLDNFKGDPATLGAVGQTIGGIFSGVSAMLKAIMPDPKQFQKEQEVTGLTLTGFKKVKVSQVDTEGMTATMNYMTGLMEKLSTVLPPLIKSIASALIDSIGGIDENKIKGLQALGPIIGSVAQLATGLIPKNEIKFPDKGSMSLTGDNINNVTISAPDLGKMLTDLSTHLPTLIDTILSVAGKMPTDESSMKQIDMLIKVFDILPKLGEMATTLADSLKDSGDLTKGGLFSDAPVNDLVTGLKSIRTFLITIKDPLSDLITTMVSVSTSIGDAKPFTDGMKKIKEIFDQMRSELKFSNIIEFIGAIDIDDIAAAKQQIVDKLPVIQDLSTQFDPFIKAISGIASGLNSLGELLKASSSYDPATLIAQFQTTIGTLTTMLTSDALKKAESLKTAATYIQDITAAGIVPAVKAVEDMMRTVQKIEDALGQGLKIDLDAKLQAFASKFGKVGAKGAYTVQARDVNIHVNFKVSMDAQSIEKIMIGSATSIIKNRINVLIDAANDSGSNAEDAQKSLSTSGKIVQGQAPSLLPGG